jgi:hypothetical protein
MQQSCSAPAAPGFIIGIDHDLETAMKAHNSTPDHPTSLRRRWALIATAGIGGLAAAPSAAASPTIDLPPAVACLWQPAADVLSFGPHLTATVRMVGTEIEVLHRVRCTDHTERWLWMPASYNGSPS